MLFVMVVRINGAWNGSPMSTCARLERGGEYRTEKTQTAKQLRARKLATRTDKQHPARGQKK